MRAITHPSLLDDELMTMIARVNELISKFTRESSGWQLSELMEFQIKIARYEPLRGSSYIELPHKYRNAKYRLINMKNSDQECFKWCVARTGCMDQVNKDRVSDRVKEEALKYDWSGITFPTPLNQLDRFEKQNEVAVSVYGLEEELYPLRVSKLKSEKHVMLLLIEEDGNRHYVIMQDLSPFINKKHKERTYPCRYCLHSFYRKELCESHEPNCSVHTPIRMNLDATHVEFKQHCNQVKHPFVIYADFESTLQTISAAQPNPEKSYNMNLQQHVPNSFAVYTKCEVDEHSKFKLYNGSDAPTVFVQHLIEETHRIYNLMKEIIPYNLTAVQQDEYGNASKCYVCNKSFTNDNYKVRDHNHLTGAYRGAAHTQCNLKIRNPKYIPVFMHNLSNYDAHLFVKEFGCVEGELKAIAQTDEKYISFSQSIAVDNYTNKMKQTINIYRELRFLDSYRFMSSSLEKLAANVPDESLHIMMQHYTNREEFNLLRRKGVYPYEWMNDDSKFDERQLPSIEHFYSSLRGEGVTDDDYLHACTVWKTFNCQTFKDYHNLYLKSDTLLLADVFENFRDTCFKTYDLDPAHYYTAPGLSWSALLKHTNIKLDLLQDPDMLLMVESGIRGGVSTISHRYAKANNPYLPESYDESKPTSYIMYLDANNLYGWAMSQYLPTGGFKWFKGHIDVMSVSDESSKGYILEVDLEYPQSLHDLHNDYPLAPENIEVNGVKKLIPNLRNKTNYIIHYRALKQYLRLGLKLIQIKRVVEFDQSAWMKSYIDLNTDMRRRANNEFEKDFYKLMNNSVFGKTMENIRNRTDVQLVKTEERCRKLVSKPTFNSFKIFSSTLAAVHMHRTKLKFDKPVYVGLSVLDLSKTLMYDFHYNTIKKKYKANAQLLFTDTDSLCYSICTKDVYDDIGKSRELYDTSNYNTDHPVHSTINKKVLGKMKDETAGKPIDEFVGLRAKLYAYSVGGEEEKRAKGVVKNVIKTKLHMNDYKRVLREKCTIHKPMIIFGTDLHQIHTKQVNKVALSGNDDKRVIQDDGIHTLAYGNYRIQSK